MNQKQAKWARGIANQEAKRQGLWKKGESDVYAKWWRKLLARLFPKLRKKYADWIGRWYKSTKKRWARLAYASVHDQDLKAFIRTRDKIRRAEQRKREKAETAKRVPYPERLKPIRSQGQARLKDKRCRDQSWPLF